LADRGAKIFQVKACASCHSVADANVKVGPALWQQWGQQRKTSGGAMALNEDYARESILNPNAKVVAGYNSNIMPSFQGQLSEIELAALIEYIKGLK
jgi:cytochrome c oxidase subunit 2